MTTIKAIAGAVAGLALSCSTVLAQSAPLLADVEWLSQHLDDRDLVLLHVGAKADYDAEHVSGARRIVEDDVALPHDHSNVKDLMLELPPVAQLRTKMVALGISDNSRIVVYAGKDVPLQSATRIVFTLDYLGLGDRTSLLNGGLAAWKRASRPVTAAAPLIAPGTLTARPAKDVVVTADFVKSVPGRANVKLVDARAAVFYKGLEPTFAKSGHIPGAISIPFTEIANPQLLIERDRLASLFRAAGVNDGDTVVAYCHVGQQATAVIFAARLLGHPVALYDGAFQDWAAYDRGAVVK